MSYENKSAHCVRKQMLPMQTSVPPLHARSGSHLFSIMRAGARCGAKRREQRLQLGHFVAPSRT